MGTERKSMERMEAVGLDPQGSRRTPRRDPAAPGYFDSQARKDGYQMGLNSLGPKYRDSWGLDVKAAEKQAIQLSVVAKMTRDEFSDPQREKDELKRLDEEMFGMLAGIREYYGQFK